jgi:membrane protease YdiL (CAAX protease family)
MLKRILIAYLVANFGLAGLAAWLAGGWYLGWRLPPVLEALAEVGLIMLPNLILPVLLLKYAWPEPVWDVKAALGWRWAGWRSLAAGLLAFAAFYLLIQVIVRLAGEAIPYNLPGVSGEGLPIRGLVDLLKVLGLLLGLLCFIGLTVAGEETMFRGWIQTQTGNRYGVWLGIGLGVLLFCLRHLPADLFYAHLWHATSRMWLSRQLQLYLIAFCLGLARHFGRSTYASALTHGLVFVVALFGLG